MALNLTVLGCSGTYAEPGGACSGYLVTSETTSLWIDCGPGTLANLQNHVTLDEVDALVVSHSHPDHWTELPVLRNAMKFGAQREGFPVYGTHETRAQAEAALAEPLDPTMVWTVIDATSRIEVGDLVVTFSLTDHPVETYAVRVDDREGRSLVYSADTANEWQPGAFAATDLFLCEATLPTELEGGPPHLSARQAGALAKASGARRLVITHHWPGSDVSVAERAAAGAYGGPVEVAAISARYTVE